MVSLPRPFRAEPDNAVVPDAAPLVKRLRGGAWRKAGDQMVRFA